MDLLIIGIGVVFGEDDTSRKLSDWLFLRQKKQRKRSETYFLAAALFRQGGSHIVGRNIVGNVHETSRVGFLPHRFFRGSSKCLTRLGLSRGLCFLNGS